MTFFTPRSGPWRGDRLFPNSFQPRISCVVCAFNEGERIAGVLETIDGHPSLEEVIVVDDGSTDDTADIVRDFPGVDLISYGRNRGKTFAMAQGIAAARGDYVMFLDADLAGLTPGDIDLLRAPVALGQADTSISLRGNSLKIYRQIGLDLVSGERLVPRWLLADQIAAMEALPRWGAEAFINALVVQLKLSIAVVDWPDVVNTRKHDKVGAMQGMMEDLRMIGDACKVMSSWGLMRQTVGMLRLVVT
jgi:glycosyltransferase involved in cell wall biosynthesis